MTVAAYSRLLLAARLVAETGAAPDALPPPKRQAGNKKPRVTTQHLPQRLRAELWGEGRRHFRSFPSAGDTTMKPQKLRHSLAAVLLFACRLVFSAAHRPSGRSGKGQTRGRSVLRPLQQGIRCVRKQHCILWVSISDVYWV